MKNKSQENFRRYRQMLRWRSKASGYYPPTGKDNVGAALQPSHNEVRT